MWKCMADELVDETAGESQGDVGQDQQDLHHRVEGEIELQEHKPHRQRHHDRPPRPGPLLVFVCCSGPTPSTVSEMHSFCLTANQVDLVLMPGAGGGIR